MQLSSFFSISFLAALGLAHTVTVASDTGAVQVNVPEPERIHQGLETRQLEGFFGFIAAMVTFIVAEELRNLVLQDIENRKYFTQNVSARLRQQTGLNVVVTNVGYTLDGASTLR